MMPFLSHEHADFIITDNKRNKFGGEFSRKLKIFIIFTFLHLVLYAWYDYKPCEQKHDIAKTIWNMQNIEYMNTFKCLVKPWEEQP